MAQMAEKFLLSRLSRTGFLILIAIAAFAVIQRETLTAITAIVAAALVFSGNTFHPGRSRQPWPAIHRLLFVALLSLLATSLWTGPWSLTHWLYVAPLVGFALLPVTWAAAITALCAVLAMSAIHWSAGLPERHQMLSALLLTVMLSGLLVFLREYKSRQLAPLRRNRRTDPGRQPRISDG